MMTEARVRLPAPRRLYHFVRPGWRMIVRDPGSPCTLFQGPAPDALVVGVNEGGPNRDGDRVTADRHGACDLGTL